MNALTTLLSHGVAERLGWTLLHSLWEATLIAAALAIVLRLLARSSAQLRYAVACVAMAAMALVPAATGGLLSLPARSVPAVGTSTSQPLPTPATMRRELAAVAAPAVPMQTSSEPARERSWREGALDSLESALPYAVGVWLAGVLLFSLRHLLAWTRVQQLRRKQVRPAEASLCDRLPSLAQRLGIERAVRLVESGLVRAPAVIGWLRPMILLPASAVSGLSREQLEALLLHELAHIRRHDYLVNLVQTILEILGFYHPAVWWVSHQIRIERENCCDDVAARALGDNLRYARALASMEDLRTDRPEPAMAASGGSLLARIRRLVGQKAVEDKPSLWTPVLVVAVLAFSLAAAAGLSFADYYSSPATALEREVLKGFAENRDKFACGVLAWTSATEDNGFAPHLSIPPGGVKYGGHYRMWWDAEKVATKYTAEGIHGFRGVPPIQEQPTWRGEDGTTHWIGRSEGGNVYAGGPFSREPRWAVHENWLVNVIQWRGRGSLDRQIVEVGRMGTAVVEWTAIDSEGTRTIRRTVKSNDSGYSVEHYDPAKGHGLVRREFFTARGQRRYLCTVRLEEVVPGAWFPVEVAMESIRVEDGSVSLRQRLSLDLAQCRFNDRTALPEGVFEVSPRQEQDQLRQILQDVREKQSPPQTTDSKARAQGPREAVERFLTAATEGDEREAAKWLHPRQPSDDLGEFKELLSGQEVRVAAAFADGEAALVVTSAIRADHGRAGPLTFHLVRSSDDQAKWQIDDIDVETPEGAEQEIQRFLQQHPEAARQFEVGGPPARVLHFPPDRSVGTLSVREWDFPTTGYLPLTDWRRLAEAKGDVTVPTGKAIKLEVSLEVSEDARQAGSPLTALQPDDIQMLDLSQCRNASDSVLGEIARLRGLRALSLTATAVTGTGLSHLKTLANLEWLSLASTQLGDEGAARLADLRSLVYLNLRYTKITDAAAAHIGRIRSLKGLSLDGTAVGDKGLASLDTLAALVGLSLWNCPITDEGLGRLAGLTQMAELDLVGTRITDRGLAHLTRMERLRRLRLTQTGVKGDGLAHLRGLKSLEYLELPHNDLADEHLAHLRGLDRLKTLYVVSDAMTEKGFQSLGGLKSLEELQTGGQGFTDAAAAVVAAFPSLKSLWIQRAPLTDEGLARLARLRSLTKLNLMQVNITGNGLAALGKLPSLTELTLDNLYIGEGEFSALGDLRMLERLSIGGDTPPNKMAFSNQDLAHLPRLGNLKRLTVVSSRISDDGLRHLSGLRSLASLELSSEGITNAGLTHLEWLGSLKSLNLAGTRVTREGVERLQRAIPGLECRL